MKTASITPQSNIRVNGRMGLGPSPRKRKAQGMFMNNDTSSEVIVRSDIKAGQNQVTSEIFHFILVNLIVRAKDEINQSLQFWINSRQKTLAKVLSYGSSLIE